jgi:dihydrolipoamide dehydrogenase
MSSERVVDVAILGAGTAGLTARRAAKKAGASVLMIDPGPFGTTCARVGCMPSKLLIAAADAAHHARNAGPFGVHADVSIDGPAVLQRVRSERDRFVGFVEDVLDDAEAEGELLRERARVVGPGVVEAGAHTVRFASLVIGTGTSPVVPRAYRDVPDDLLLTTERIFEMDDLPESLLVVGLGVIGLELGQAFDRLGVRTTLLGIGGAIGPLMDPEVLDCAREVFGAALDLHPEHDLRRVRVLSDGSGVEVHFVDRHGAERTERFARILMAAGRRTTLPGLGLESLGLDPSGPWPIDPTTLQLGDLPVFVAGDANELHPLLHEASDDGRIAGRNAARYPEVQVSTRRTTLGIVFSEPQVAVVGQSFAVLGDCAAAVGRIDYADQGRARVQRTNEGIVRIYANASDARLVGAELFGPRVEHLAHLLAWAVQAGLTVDQALQMPFYHPVVEEGIRTALRDLAVHLERGERIKCRVSELGVGS